MTVQVRAKFKCWRIERNKSTDPDDQMARVHLMPVYEDGKGVNAEWSKWTPGGQIEMYITGGEYFMDFTRAD
ncbi:hypothetical protein [Mesorhizobium xinjiangense]|uniref:hypothetical protein n=1 Tax=Mesorhizobium xinjiangense TaxID=2678685 RepID=UPI0012EEB951|nr:hypothetical protein [Mesorhizobium xinjiangense]